MTNDSKLFPPRPKWEEWGYRPDEYSRWIKGPWKPIPELWQELGIDPTKPVPLEPECQRRIREGIASDEVAATFSPDSANQLRCAQPSEPSNHFRKARGQQKLFETEHLPPFPNQE